MLPALNQLKRLSTRILPPQCHPEPALQVAWDVLQWSILALPYSLLLGCLGTVIATGMVWRLRSQSLIRRPVNRGLFGLSGLLIVGSMVAERPADACLGLAHFLPFFIVFAALCELIQTPAQLRRLAWIIVCGSVPVALIGLGQQIAHWGGTIQVLWVLIHWVIPPEGSPPGRMSSIFAYATVLACYTVITFSLSLGLWIDTSSQLKVKPSTAMAQHMLLTLAVGLNAAAIVLSNSRNAWAIAVVVALAFALYIGWHWLVLGVSAIAGLILGSAFGPLPLRDWLRTVVPAFFWARLTDQLYPNRPIATLRTTQWHFALQMMQQRPWSGWGLRNFGPIYQEQMQVFIGHPHNLLLMLLAEIGIPATGLLVGLVGWLISRASWLLWQQTWTVSPPWPGRHLLFTYLLAFGSCTLFYGFDIPLFDARINLLGWLLLAGISGVVDTSRRSKIPLAD